MKRTVWLAVVVLMLGAVYAQAESPPCASPILPVAQWSGKPVSMEDLKGHTTVVVFFNDSKG